MATPEARASSGEAPLRLTLANELAEVERARQQVDAFLAPHALGRRTRYAVELVIEELLVNVISHAFPDNGRHDIELSVSVDRHEVVVTVDDDGIAFDPLRAPEPPVPATLEQATPGGLGIRLLRRYASHLAYTRSDGRNRLTAGIARAD